MVTTYTHTNELVVAKQWTDWWKERRTRAEIESSSVFIHTFNKAAKPSFVGNQI